MKYSKINRRMFLQGAGTTLAIPFLPSLFSSSAEASVSTPISNYVHINSNLTMTRTLSYPLYYGPYPSYTQVANANPSLVPWIQKDADTKYQSLQQIVDLQGKISFIFDEKWNPYAKRMNLITNAHAYISDNRHNCGLSSACSIGPDGMGSSDVLGPKKQYATSVDYLIEQKLGAAAGQTIRMNMYENDGGYQTFSFGNVNGVPSNLYMMQSVGELGLKLTGANGNSAAAAANANRTSRLNSVLDDFKNLMNHRRISSADKMRLGNAADMWSSVESKLGSGSTRSCTLPNLGSITGNFGDKHRAALDAIALAMSCGITHNVNYGLIQGGDDMNDQGVLHGWEHDPRNSNEADPTIADPYFSMVCRWRADLVAYFLKKLDSLQNEAGGSLLDSSLVVWGHQFSSNGHGMLGHTLLQAGGANGKLDTGWHVDAGGAPVNRFHITNMMAMGLSMSDIEKNGNVGFGEIAAIYNTGAGGELLTREQDDKQNDTTKRAFDTSKLTYFAQDSERRKAFPYLKG